MMHRTKNIREVESAKQKRRCERSYSLGADKRGIGNVKQNTHIMNGWRDQW